MMRHGQAWRLETPFRYWPTTTCCGRRSEGNTPFTRNGLWDADPEAYVTATAEDRSYPIGDTTMFNLPAYDYVKGMMASRYGMRMTGACHRWVTTGSTSCDRTGPTRWGRFDSALRLLRKQVMEAGDNWEELLPFRYGEGVSGFRNGVEQMYVKLGWLRKHETHSGHEANTARIVDYVLNRVMSDDVQAEHYQWLEPKLLLGAVDFVSAADACERLEQEAGDEADEALQ